jgi:hypothetical protein
MFGVLTYENFVGMFFLISCFSLSLIFNGGKKRMVYNFVPTHYGMAIHLSKLVSRVCVCVK